MQPANKISSTDGFEILKKWKKQRTLLSALWASPPGDFHSWQAFVKQVDGGFLTISKAGSRSLTEEWDLAGATFRVSDSPGELEVPFPEAAVKRFSIFLFVLLSNGSRIVLGVPIGED
jgi:hypothetical protein